MRYEVLGTFIHDVVIGEGGYPSGFSGWMFGRERGGRLILESSPANSSQLAGIFSCFVAFVGNARSSNAHVGRAKDWIMAVIAISN